MIIAIALGVLAVVLFLLFVAWITRRKNLLRRLCRDLLEIAAQREKAAATILDLMPKICEANQAFETLLSKNDYFRNSEYLSWLEGSKDIAKKELLEQAILGLPEAEATLATRFRSRIVHARAEIDDRNDEFVERKRVEYKKLLQSLVKHPLTEEQERVILHDEDRTLVIAGAGTGKTTALLAKARFLVLSGTATPEDLLLLSFGRDVADKMRQGLRSLGVEPDTFHGLGRSLMTQVGTERLSASKLAKDNKDLARFIEGLIREMLTDPAEQELFSFLLNDLSPVKLWIECKTKKEYWEYIRAHEPRALRGGEKLRSFEEVRIANFLFSQAIQYEYERNYEHKTTARGHQQYKPDFYLPDYGIYIEHFGIGRDGKPGFLRGLDAVGYRRQMKWKRQLHIARGTTLVESYSWEAKEGVLEKKLAQHLRELGVEFKPKSCNEMLAEFSRSGHVKRLAKLLASFLNLYKEGLHELAELRQSSDAEPRRTKAILAVFSRILNTYEEELRRRDEIDFHDMIRNGRQVLDSGRISLRYRYVLVDEFQDVSPAKVRFLQSILAASREPHLFCVGDDWQSIYRFAGSDVTVMTHFADYFDFHKEAVPRETFRFGEDVEEVSSNFVLRNPQQLRKRLVPRESGVRPAIHLLLDDKPVSVEKATESALERALTLIALRGKGKRLKILVLGRYKRTSTGKQKIIDRVTMNHPLLNIEFRTIHKSKGLEADYVVIDDVIREPQGYGFPCKISDDPVIRLLLSYAEDYPNAEERRLFYVALTRTRNDVFLISRQGAISDFVQEIKDEINLIDIPREFGLSPCPKCGVGLLDVKKGRYGPYEECNLCGCKPGKRAI